jgi:predicted nucleic acid-binding protein
MSPFLIDTNVFSEIFKGNTDISAFVAGLDAYIDTVIYIECLQGSKSNDEKARIKKVLSTFPLLPINQTVSEIAIDLIGRYSNTHGLVLADALIASSALSAGLTVLTYNASDFQFIENLNCSLPVLN